MPVSKARRDGYPVECGREDTGSEDCGTLVSVSKARRDGYPVEGGRGDTGSED